MRYDLIVLGSDLPGRKAAEEAARQGRLVAMVDPAVSESISVADHAWRIPFPTIRRQLFDALCFVPRDLTIERASTEYRRVDPGDAYRAAPRGRTDAVVWGLRKRIADLMRAERLAATTRMRELGVDILIGEARFENPHEIELVGPGGRTYLTADEFVIATGTTVRRSCGFDFRSACVTDADEILAIDRVPDSTFVIGGSSTGMDVALAMQLLGSRVVLVDGLDQLPELPAGQRKQRALFDRLGGEARTGMDVIAVTSRNERTAQVTFADGTTAETERVICCVGRIGKTARLNLSAAGVGADERGRLWCNSFGQTWMPHIFAAGTLMRDSTLRPHSSAHATFEFPPISHALRVDNADWDQTVARLEQNFGRRNATERSETALAGR